MGKIKIIQKYIEAGAGYAFGEVFDVAAVGDEGVTIVTGSGQTVSLRRGDYIELTTEPETPEEDVPVRDICAGDIVRHFKREWVPADTSEYLYKVLAFARYWLLPNIRRRASGSSCIRLYTRPLRYAPGRTPCS